MHNYQYQITVCNLHGTLLSWNKFEHGTGTVTGLHE